MREDIQEILFDEKALARRVAELGARITADYTDRADEGLVLACALRGAAVFAADLMRCIDLPMTVDFVFASSYGMGTTSTGEVLLETSALLSVEGKHVLIVEDILDEGHTMKRLHGFFETQGARSVEAVALLLRKNRPNRDFVCKYVGFECDDGFIVGYGLDYAQRYRNLPYVAIIKPEVYSSL